MKVQKILKNMLTKAETCFKLFVVAKTGNRKRGERVVNTDRLSEFIEKSGKKKGYLAEKVGISRQALRNKMLNITEFTSTEVNILCSELGITKLTDKEQIFFANDVPDKRNT